MNQLLSLADQTGVTTAVAVVSAVCAMRTSPVLSVGAVG